MGFSGQWRCVGGLRQAQKREGMPLPCKQSWCSGEIGQQGALCPHNWDKLRDAGGLLARLAPGGSQRTDRHPEPRAHTPTPATPHTHSCSLSRLGRDIHPGLNFPSLSQHLPCVPTKTPVREGRPVGAL